MADIYFTKIGPYMAFDPIEDGNSKKTVYIPETDILEIKQNEYLLTLNDCKIELSEKLKKINKKLPALVSSINKGLENLKFEEVTVLSEDVKNTHANEDVKDDLKAFFNDTKDKKDALTNFNNRIDGLNYEAKFVTFSKNFSSYANEVAGKNTVFNLTDVEFRNRFVFVIELLKTLYNDPFIVREFFTSIEASEEVSTDLDFKATDCFNADNMDIRLQRLDNIIRQEQDETQDVKKSEGIYAYRKGLKTHTDSFVNEKINNWIGYVPFVKYKDKQGSEQSKYSSLAKRRVFYDFKKILKNVKDKTNRIEIKKDWRNNKPDDDDIKTLNQINHFDNGFDFPKRPAICIHDFGYIFPNATNTDINGNSVDNRLLFHWVGDSLGVDSPFEGRIDDDENDQQENDKFELNNFIADFIDTHLFKKKTIYPAKQPPLNDGIEYSFGMFPVTIDGRYYKSNIENSDYIKTLCTTTTRIDNDIPDFEKLASLFEIPEEKNVIKPFEVTDSINSPQIIEEKNFTSCTKNSNPAQVIMLANKNVTSSKRNNVTARLVILPPKIDFNIARCLGVFNTSSGGGVNEVKKGIKRIENDFPDKPWSICYPDTKDIPYLFDKRVLECKIQIQLFRNRTRIDDTEASNGKDQWKYGNEIEKIGSNTNETIIPAKLITKSDKMSNYEAVELRITTNDKITESTISIENNGENGFKRIEINVPHGKTVYAKFTYIPPKVAKTINDIEQKVDKYQTSKEGTIVQITSAVSKPKEDEFEVTVEPKDFIFERIVNTDKIKYWNSELFCSEDSGNKESNFDILDYFYLFRKYTRIAPAETKEYPGLKQLKERRKLLKDHKDDSAIDIQKSTDIVLFGKSSSKTNDLALEYVKSNGSSSSGHDETITKNGSDNTSKQNEVEPTPEINFDKNEIFHEDYLYTLDEAFGKDIVELLQVTSKPIEIPAGGHKVYPTTSIGGKTYFNKKFKEDDDTNEIGYLEILEPKINNKPDKRSKTINWYDFKVYSKHLRYFKEKRVDNKLHQLDYNYPIFGESIIEDGLTKEEKTPPKFELDLLFLNRTEDETPSNGGESRVRSAFLLISFEKEDLNLMSDDEYIGIDYSEETDKPVFLKNITTYKTDIGVDFTINRRTILSIKDDVFSHLNPAIKVIDKKPMIQLVSSDNLDDNYYEPNVLTDNHVGAITRFFKPYYSSILKKAIILIDLSELAQQFEHEIDPFLKISLLRAYQKDGEWIKSSTSEPSFIQISSKREIKITRSNNKYSIIINTPAYNKATKRRLLYFYSVNFKPNSIKNEEVQFKIVADSTVENIVSKHISIFEFHVFDNFNIEHFKPENMENNDEWEKAEKYKDKFKLILKYNKNFNPFNYPEFKLVFTC